MKFCPTQKTSLTVYMCPQHELAPSQITKHENLGDTGPQNVVGQSEKWQRASGWDDAKIGKIGLGPKESRAWERLCIPSPIGAHSLSVQGGGGPAVLAEDNAFKVPSSSFQNLGHRREGRNWLGEMFLCPIKKKPATSNLRTDNWKCLSRKLLPWVTMEVTGSRSLWETVWG